MKRLHPSGLAMRCDQSRHLGPAQAGQSGDEAPHQTLAPPAQAGVLVPHQGLLHPTVHILAPLPGKLKFAAAGEECSGLLQVPDF
jgi:hypothetical protein